MNNIVLSIIIPTLGRKKELKALFESIVNTEIECSFETLVIDQNEDGLIDELCDMYRERLNLVHHHVHFKGASKARNYGIDYACGEVVCFPDDDAEMTENTIAVALNLLREKKIDCVFGKCIDKNTKADSVIHFKEEKTVLTLDNFEGAFVEATMFAKRDLFISCRYDENMGVGCIFGSQEGYDLVYRLLKDKKQMLYSPEIVFFHPQKIETRTTDAEIKRVFYYSCGFGYLCKKHSFKKKYIMRLLKISVGIPVIAIFKHNQLRYYRAQKMGMQLGFKYL